MKKLILVLFFSIFPYLVNAAPIKVVETVTITGKIQKVWRWTGGFCSIRIWHPAIDECEITKEGKNEFRMLALKNNGGLIKEKYESGQVYGYSYTIISGPLPVKDYKATFMAEQKGEEVVFNWTATFNAADGIANSKAKSVVSGVLSDGLQAIKKRYDKKRKKDK